jgi:hypothetical protein
LAGWPAEVGLAVGADAVIRGHVDAVLQDGRWSGELDGLMERIDLASCTSRATHRLTGEATVSVSRFRVEASRLAACDLECSASAGRVGQDFLDAAVRALGCRAGPAFRSLAYDPLRRFDGLGFSLRIDGDGMLLRAPGDRRTAATNAQALMQVQGITMLEEPLGTIPTDRLAWLFSPPGRAAVPASDESAWLISKLPLSGGNQGESRVANGEQPTRPLPPRAGQPGAARDF